MPGTASANQDITVSFDIGPGCSYDALLNSLALSVSDSAVTLTCAAGRQDPAQTAVGDTITYCLHWSNDPSSATPMVLWDTLHPVLSYVGADPAPGVTGSYLRWDLGPVAAGSSGQICFWARITGYP